MRKLIPPKLFTAKLSKIKKLTDDVTVFTFEHEANAFEFYPGQFVMVEFMGGEQGGKKIQRAYSIASAPHSTQFELCVKIIPGGLATQYLASLQVGDEATFKGGFGMCTINEDAQNELLFVATGTGLAPVKAIVDDLINKSDNRLMTILFGVRHEDDIFWQDYFESLATKYENIKFLLTLSQPADNWTGLTGRVTDHLAKYDFARPDLELYLCGSGAMIKSVREIALAGGMTKERLHIENFG